MVIASTGRKGTVDRIAFPSSGSRLSLGPSPRIQGELVDAEIQNARVLIKDLLGSITMVDVPVNDRNLLEAVLSLKVSGTDRYIIKQAEPHGPIRFGMVPRWPESTEGVVDLSGHYSVCCDEGPFYRQLCCLIGKR
jgi:hypothetical protein